MHCDVDLTVLKLEFILVSSVSPSPRWPHLFCHNAFHGLKFMFHFELLQGTRNRYLEVLNP